MNRVIGLGAGGHAKVVLDILQQLPGHTLVGLLDRDSGLHGNQVLGVPVLGSDDLLPALRSEGITHFFVGVGAVGGSALRAKLYEWGIAQGLSPVSAIHPRATVAASAVLGPGATLMAGVVINAGACLGANVVVNTSVIIEHDCAVEDHVYLAPGACLLGAAQIGRAAFVGASSVIRQGLRVGPAAVVGAGAVVIQDVAPGVTVVGVPARPLGDRGGPR